MRRRLNGKEVRALLRRGDPAGVGSQPDAVEIARLRAAVLSAAVQRLPTQRLLRWATLCSAVVLAATASWILLRRPPSVPVAPVARAADARPVQRPVPNLPEPRVATRIAGVPHTPTHPVRARRPVQPEVKTVRQIHLVAPGGTRIIWLVPSSESL